MRVAISPANGARRTQSFTSRVARCILAWVSISSAALLALSAARFSISFGEAKPPSFSSATRAASWASASCCAWIARACIATAFDDAEAFRQSSVAIT